MMDMVNNLQAWFDCQMMMIGGQMCDMCSMMMPS